MQTFRRSANSIAKLSIVVMAGLVAGLGYLGLQLFRAPYVTHEGEVHEQPVVFSHEHHVAGLGLDCRYCHTSVEKSGFAGLPPSATCMNCHRQIWTNADLLAPVRESYATNTPLRWTRVHDLPDFVYFNHSIHIAKGVGCTSCHGPIGEMNITWRGQTLYMRWCLECHNAPENFLRPRSEVFNAFYQAPGNQLALGRRLMKEYKVQKLTNCTTCHR